MACGKVMRSWTSCSNSTQGFTKLDGLRQGDALVDIVQQLDFLSEFHPNVFKHLRRLANIGGRLEDDLRVGRSRNGCLITHCAARRSGCAPCTISRISLHRHLYPYITVSKTQGLGHVIIQLCLVCTLCVIIQIDAKAHFTTEQLVHRHIGFLSFYIPQFYVDTAHSIEKNATISPI